MKDHRSCSRIDISMKRSTAPVSQKFEFRSSLTLFQACLSTVKPLYNEPLYNEVLVTTNGFHYPAYSKIYGKKLRYRECTFCQSLGSSLYRGFTVRKSDDLLYIKFSFFSTAREQQEMTDEFQLFKAISARKKKKNFLS